MKNSLIWLKAAFTVSLFLLMQEIPIWATTVGVLLFLWKIILDSAQWSPPQKWMTGVIAVAVLVFSRLHYGSFIGRENAATLFLVLGALKLLEVTNERDRQFTRFLILGALSVKFLFAIELWVFVPALVGTFLIFLDFRNATKESVQEEIKTIGRIWLYAAPLAILFFVIFPRFQSPFGSRETKAISGFSPSLGPGSVAQLALSREPVMRIVSPGKNFGDGYWVGDYLYQSEGLSWTKGSRMGSGRSPQARRILSAEFLDREPSFVVTLEPHRFSSLFHNNQTEALSIPGQSVFQLPDGTFSLDYSVTSRIQYNGFSYPDERKRVEPKLLSASAVDLLSHPELSEDLKKEFEFITSQKNWDRRKKIEGLISYVQTKNFKYTLNPGGSSQSLDDFILKGKKGFCEHYAAGFGTVIRYLGIPARTVVGYQGGEWNEVGSYLLITQQDAHAWIEFENDNGIFEKLDLVNFVAPERLTLGAREFSERFDQETGELIARTDGVFSQFLVAKNTVILWLDSVNYLWIQFLIDFNIEKQKEFIQRFKDLWPIFLLLIVVSMGGLSMVRQLKKASKHNAASEAVKTLHQWGISKGWLNSEMYEGPLGIEEVFKKNRIEPEAVEKIFKEYKELTFYESNVKPTYSFRSELKKIKKALKASEL